MSRAEQGRPAIEGAFAVAATGYDSWFDQPLGQTVDALEKDLVYGLAGLRPGERVLEVGSGTGHFGFDLVNRGHEVVGLDLSPTMLAVARRKGRAVHLVRGDALTLPVASASFALVLSVTVLEFVADPQQALQEMWRAVRPGGRLVAAVLNAHSPWAWVRRRQSRQQETFFSQAHFFSPREFTRLMGALGPVRWDSAVFIGPQGAGMSCAWGLERLGRSLLRPFGALLVGRVTKCR